MLPRVNVRNTEMAERHADRSSNEVSAESSVLGAYAAISTRWLDDLGSGTGMPACFIPSR